MCCFQAIFNDGWTNNTNWIEWIEFEFWNEYGRIELNEYEKIELNEYERIELNY